MSEEIPQAAAETRCVFCEVSEAMGPLLHSFGGSEKVTSHFRASRLEFLKGLRAMLDERIEHMAQPPRKGTRVEVE